VVVNKSCGITLIVNGVLVVAPHPSVNVTVNGVPAAATEGLPEISPPSDRLRPCGKEFAGAVKV
jgi:hypothetical protein